jgi:predicted metal-dependent HD superfamily phosphohydrolase
MPAYALSGEGQPPDRNTCMFCIEPVCVYSSVARYELNGTRSDQPPYTTMGIAGSLEKTADHVFALFKRSDQENIIYHSYNHTVETVEACRHLADGLGLSEHDSQIVLIAAWFHDTGYLEDGRDHEEKSVEIARSFLKSIGYPEPETEQIGRCILATRMPQQPQNLLEEIVCDADLSHLGMPGYPEKSELLRREIEKTENRTFTDREWLRINIDFFNQHPFFTRHANIIYNEERSKNLIDLLKRLKKLEKSQDQRETSENGKDEIEKKEKERGIERNMEVYYRTTSRNHVDFSAIVDHKANIMIQTNSLIFSIIISLLVRKLDELPNLILPTFILLLSCVATIVTSVLATRPKITKGETTIDSIKNRKANLLFFGSFIKLKMDEYEWGMKEMLKDKSYYVDNMIRDTYYLGKVLDYKYKFLRLSYDIFMGGLVISIALYILAFFRQPA